MQYLPGDETSDLVEAIESNTRRYQKLFAAAADEILETKPPPRNVVQDVFDVLWQQVTKRTFVHALQRGNQATC